MEINEFLKYINSKDHLEDLLVRLRYKYSWEDHYTYSNEVLVLDFEQTDNYIWLNDWDEGQEDVIVLGYIAIDEIKIPHF